MANPIAQSTEAFLATLDGTVREAAEETVGSNSKRSAGVEFTLTEEINLAKAIKQIASVDGFSREERSALGFLMIMAGIPHRMQQEVLDFDVTDVRPEHVAELFPHASRKAAYVLSGATTVAAFDGLSEEEELEARELGVRLGLSAPLIDELVDNALRMGLAMNTGNRAKVELLEAQRLLLISGV